MAARNDDVTVDGGIPAPLKAVSVLLKSTHVAARENGQPPRNEEAHERARDEVRTWLIRLQVEEGRFIPQDTQDWVRDNPEMWPLGGCPECHRNDGYLVVKEDHWAICHEHQKRWAMDPDLAFGFFRPSGESLWDDPDRPLRRYAVVKPVNLTAYAKVVRLPVLKEPPPRVEDEATAKPRLRLVRGTGEGSQDTDVWPPPGGATVGERAFRLVCWAYLLFVLVPRDYWQEFVQWLTPEPEECSG
jgi:hypothetical protein